MVQHWQVIAPARKETTGVLGELMNALASNSAGGLVPLLAVPLNAHRSADHIIRRY
jgi:hypothetical protein